LLTILKSPGSINLCPAFEILLVLFENQKRLSVWRVVELYAALETFKNWLQDNGQEALSKCQAWWGICKGKARPFSGQRYIYIYSSTCSKMICFGLLCYIFRQKITRNCEMFATIHAGDAGETVYIQNNAPVLSQKFSLWSEKNLCLCGWVLLCLIFGHMGVYKFRVAQILY